MFRLVAALLKCLRSHDTLIEVDPFRSRPPIHESPLIVQVRFTERALPNPARTIDISHRLRLLLRGMLGLVVEEERTCAVIDEVELIWALQLAVARVGDGELFKELEVLVERYGGVILGVQEGEH